MEKAITTIIITIASIVAITVVVNAMLPTIQRTGSAVVGSASAVDDRLRSEIEIIHATGQPGTTTAYAWVKNVGIASIPAIERTDVFFGVNGNFARIPYGGPGCAAPCWEYTVENASNWEPTATVRINLYLTNSIASGVTYYLKVVIANGVTDTKYFSL
jgi:archaellum component FlaG (FlaF/FlaG flagellin family)